MSKKRDPGLNAAIKAATSITALSEIVGTTRQNVSAWKRIPSHHCKLISKKLKIPLETLRSDIY